VDEKVMPASMNVEPASDGKPSINSSGGKSLAADGKSLPNTKTAPSSKVKGSAAQDVLHTANKLVTRIFFVKVFIFSPQLKITPWPNFEVAGGRNKASMA
jgi:hypothetical protein